MKSSNRSPRYRRRFQTLTRGSRRQLALHLRDHNQPPGPLEAQLLWGALLHGLSLKSAQEVGASPAGLHDARMTAEEIFGRTSGTSFHSRGDYFDPMD